MHLEKINIKEFKKTIYQEYKKLFPKKERRTYREIKNGYYNNITEIIKIIIENKCVGFFIANHLKNNPYLHLDYFAIIQEYQSKGYGTEAIKKLKEYYKNYDGIFIEIEQIDEAVTEVERKTRQRRADFYERLGFCKMEFGLELYKVKYSTYMLPCEKDIFNEEEVINEIFKIYNAVYGEKSVQKNCKVNNVKK